MKDLIFVAILVASVIVIAVLITYSESLKQNTMTECYKAAQVNTNIKCEAIK